MIQDVIHIETELTPRLNGVITFFAIVFFMCGALSPAQADEGREKLSNLAEELVNLRSKVDELSSELELKKAQMREDLRALAVQKKDLERQIKNEEVKIRDLDQKIGKQTAEITKKKQQREKLSIVVLEIIDKTKEYLRKTLPFKIEERIGELDRLREQLQTREMGGDKVLARIWSVFEDEFRLTKETGLYKQSIEINGKNCLSEVARLGMVLMYVKTIDEKTLGYAKKDGNKWSYVTVTDEEDRDRILYLFDCLKKHIQEGFFELPNPFAAKKTGGSE